VDETKVLALTSVMSFKNLAAALSSLVLEVTGPETKPYLEFNALMGKIQQFEEFKNQVSHSVWAHFPDFEAERATRIKTTARQGRGVKHDREDVEITRAGQRRVIH